MTSSSISSSTGRSARIGRRLLVPTLAGLAIVGLAAAPASAAETIGDNNADYAGQGVYFPNTGTTCTLTAGDPVVVSIDGRRYLQAVNTLGCDKTVRISDTYNSLGVYPNYEVSVKNTGVLYASSASVVLRRQCNGSNDVSWASKADWGIDSDGNGYIEARVYDRSRWNLRSCGV